MRLTGLIAASTLFCLSQCSSSDSARPPLNTVISFNLGADLSQAEQFWDFPYPSDLRLTANGAPDVRGFPNTLNAAIITGLQRTVEARKGYPVLPVAYFKFNAPISPRHFTDVIAADATQPIMLIDVDRDSPERGSLFPVVAETPPADRYVPDSFLAVTPRPGMLLHPLRKYAFVVMRSLKDATGAQLGVPAALAALQKPLAPADGNPAWALYQPLWETLGQAKVDAAQVASATVFTTGDVVQATFDESSKVIANTKVLIQNLAVRTSGNQLRNCELVGTVTYPQYQKGTPPFDTDGQFVFGPDGAPIKQRDEVAPISISLPQTAMPQGGYPLIVYVHGSGGLSVQALDRGKITAASPNGTLHEGPAFVMAPFGFAMAGSAMPVNPERLKGATDLAYINFNNLAAFPYTFRQGVFEQRLFIDALSLLTIEPSVVSTCTNGVSLPNGASSYKFDVTRLAMQGQSMGAQYVNMVTAVEPRVGAVAPSGGGGYWSNVVLTNKVIPNTSGNVGLLLGTAQKLTFLHPALHLLETAWESADAIVYMRRLSRLPLSAPPRDIYEPAGKDDEYFATEIYDAMALAYGNKEAGDQVWQGMQTALALGGRGGIEPYPINQNLTTDDGKSKYTGAVIQYAGDGAADPHYVFQQLDAVKYQYGCFFATYQKNGHATIPAPAALGTPCPGL